MTRLVGLILIGAFIYYAIYSIKKYRQDKWRWSGFQLINAISAAILGVAMGVLLLLEKVTLSELLGW